MKTDPQRVNDSKVLCSSMETWWKEVIAYCFSTKAGGELRPVLYQPLQHEAGGRHAGVQDGSLEQRRRRGALLLTGDLVEGGDRLLLLHQGRRRAETDPLSAAAA